MQKIKVLLVEDHSIVREGIKLVLGLDQRLKIIGEAENLSEALDLISYHAPDVVLLDYRLPDGDGVIGCEAIKRRFPKTKVIILTAFATDQIVKETIRAGAEGYLLKSIDSEELIKEIIRVYAGRVVLDSRVAERIVSEMRAEAAKADKLSNREHELLELISTGKTNSEIAEILGISEKTVRNCLTSVFKKLNVSNRTEATAYWLRQDDSS